MGGRGASGGVGSEISRYESNGVAIYNATQMEATRLNQFLSGVSSVLSDMGLPLSTVRAISIREMRSAEDAATDAANTVIINSKLSANTSSEFVASGIRGLGAHEAGHVVIGAINRIRYNGDTAKINKAFQTRSTEKSIIREASRSYGSNPKISRYGSTSPAETIAEAVSDVYTNGGKANPYSREIVRVLKKRLR